MIYRTLILPILLLVALTACSQPTESITAESVEETAEPGEALTGEPASEPTPKPTEEPATEEPTEEPATLPASTEDEASTAGCQVTVPPEGQFDPFYQKYCDLGGLPVLASADVPDLALQAAWQIAANMLNDRPDVLAEMVSNGTLIGVIGVNEVTSDMPEYRNIYTDFPGVDWDTRARGLGATPYIPLTTGAEENLLCYPADPYLGESIFLHEFSHTIKIMGLEFLDPAFAGRVADVYTAAINAGLWANTYADDNVDEYWAEGVQDFFDTNLESIPSNGIHNEINTRAELKEYDPDLYDLIAGVFGEPDWTPGCPG